MCRWRLLYTSRPGSASPIQRAFTGTEAFKIFQEVQIAESGPCRVNNVVEFGDEARSVQLAHAGKHKRLHAGNLSIAACCSVSLHAPIRFPLKHRA